MAGLHKRTNCQPVRTDLLLRKMNWDKETVIRFLELYQMNPCIWDPGNEGHKNRQRVNDAWNHIKNAMGVPCTLQELKKKRESLMSAYRGYKTKIKKSEKSGSGAADVYQPSWFAYAYMDSFLNCIYTCNSTMNTLDEEPTINEDQNLEQAPTDQNTISHEQQGSNEQQGATARPILNRRRQNNPPELIQAKKRMDEAYSFMQYHSQRQLKDEDDECSTFGVLVARKLRKLSEERRDIMMAKIHQLFIDEHVYNFNLSNYSSSRPNSAATMLSYSPSPPQINIASPPAVAFPTDVTSLNSATSHSNSAVTMSSYAPSPPQINIASLPEVALPTEVASFNCANRHPNSTTRVSYTPSSPQMDAPSPAYYVEYSNDTPPPIPRRNHTVTSQADAPSPAYYVEYSNDTPPPIPRGNHTVTSQTDAPSPAYYVEYSNDTPPPKPRGNHTVTSPTAVSYQRPNTITSNTVSEGTPELLKDFIIMRRK